MIKFFISFSLFFIVNQSVLAKNNVLQVSIKGKSYEKLQLKMTLSPNTSWYIQGSSQENNLWEFQIPDSLYERSQKMVLVVPSDNNTVHQLTLSYITSQDTIRTSDFFTKKKFSKLEFEYIETFTEEKASYFMFKDAIFDCYFASVVDLEFESSMIKLQSLFGFFAKPNSYENNLKKYVSLVNKYPESHSLIANLYTTLNNYKSKDDVERVFSCFSESQKNSYYGQLIHSYLHVERLPNMQLQVMGEEREEAVVANAEKDNLIIFTASWCQPCHKLIPVLKELYTQLKEKLIFTYISIDDSKTISKWPKIIQENEIPWRCLVATDKLDEVMKRYTIQGIPLAYYVSANGSYKKINLQNSDEREKLTLELLSK